MRSITSQERIIMNNFRKKAFTLAEVLITLGIIGVVAALTMPTLMANYRKSVVEKKIYTTYNILQNALGMSVVDNGDPMYWSEGNNYDDDFFEKYFVPYLKVINSCHSTEDEDCSTTMKNINGTSTFKYNRKYILSNGTGIMYNAGDVGQRKGSIVIDTMMGKERVIGKNAFTLNFIVTDSKYYITSKTDYTEDFCNVNKTNKSTLISLCKSASSGQGFTLGIACTALIECNGWQLPKEYPVKF